MTCRTLYQEGVQEFTRETVLAVTVIIKNIVKAVELTGECMLEFCTYLPVICVFINQNASIKVTKIVGICTCAIGVRFSIMNNQGKNISSTHIRKKLRSELFKYVISEEQNGFALLNIIDCNQKFLVNMLQISIGRSVALVNYSSYFGKG